MFLVHKFLPTVGGTQTLSYNIAKRLAQKHDVTLLTSGTSLMKPEEDIDGIHVRRFKFRMPLGRPWYTTLGMIPAVNEEIRQGVDLIHSFHWVTFQALLGSMAYRVHGTPLVLTASYHQWDGWYEKTVAKMVLKSARILIAQCQTERTELFRSSGRRDIRVIPCGIDTAKFRQLPPRGELRRKLNIGASEKVILYVGATGSHKGLQDLFLAHANLLKHGNIARLLVVGGQKRSEPFFPNSNPSVIVLGRVPQEELLEAYATADVFAFPSKSESFGIALVEAAAAGIPIVSTSVGVAPEIVRDGSTGFLCNGANEFAKSLGTVLNDGKFAVRSAELKPMILRQYSWECVTEAISDSYQLLPAASKSVNDGNALGKPR